MQPKPISSDLGSRRTVQTRLIDFFPICKRRPQPLPESQSLKKMKRDLLSVQWCRTHRDSLPLELALEVMSCLSVSDTVLGFGQTCSRWRVAMKVFSKRRQDYYSPFSSIEDVGSRFSLKDISLIFRLGIDHMAVTVFRTFLTACGLTHSGEIRHFCKSARFHIELDSASSAVQIFRLKHSKQYGELLIRPEAIASICQSALLELDLQNCFHIGRGLITAIAKCGNLRVLNLSNGDSGDEELQVLSQHQPQLRRLILRGLPQLTEVALGHISHLNVTELDLSYSANAIAMGLHRLNSLSLTHLLLEGLNLTDSDFEIIANQSRLHTLSLRKCERLTESQLNVLGTGLVQLVRLNISEIPALLISETAIFQMLEVSCVHLTHLFVSGHLMSMRVQQLLTQRQSYLHI